MFERKIMQYVIAALYKFVRLGDYAEMKKPLLEKMRELNIKGTFILAAEGINGTVSGTRESIDSILNYLKSDERLSDLEHKESYSDSQAFYRTKVKLKKEIVTLGVEDLDPVKDAGTYLTPDKWNEILNDPELILVDTRNEYEVKIGSFEGAVTPDIKSFRELPVWIDRHLDPSKHKKVAMFCTGGIRCEKSTALLRKKGFENVYHLRGGILKYLEEIETVNSKWQGECFVFDQRVSVDHDLSKGAHDQCYACRMPINDEDKKSDKYIPGVSCPHCYDKLSDEQKIRFAERARQMRLARLRGEEHIYDGNSVVPQKSF